MRLMFIAVVLLGAMGCGQEVDVGSQRARMADGDSLSGDLGGFEFALEADSVRIRETEEYTTITLMGVGDDFVVMSQMNFFELRLNDLEPGIHTFEGSEVSALGCYGPEAWNWDYDNAATKVELEVIDLVNSRLIFYDVEYRVLEGENPDGIHGMFELN